MSTNKQLKRIGAIILADGPIVDDFVSDDQESISDSDFSESVSESDDTSTEEHISVDSDSSDSDIDENDGVSTLVQPEKLEKGGVVWSTDPLARHGRLRATDIIKTKPGFPTKVPSIFEAFKLFLTNEILDEIVFHTNRYAEQYFTMHRRLQTDSRRWHPIDRLELESFIGLLIKSGMNRTNHESLNVLWDISESPPVYRATMSIQRFKFFLRFVRFDDRQQRKKSDRLAPIRRVFELFRRQLPLHFIPSENLTIDEQLVPFRGRCGFIQYMPKKPVKYGLKFWILSDASSRYVLSINLYTGRENNTTTKNLSSDVVLNLVDQLRVNVKQGRCVTFDRYFTNLALSNELLARSMTCVGVVDPKRSFVPNELKVRRRDLHSTWYYFCDGHMILSYQAKEKQNPVILLSSAHAFGEEFDDDKKLPCAIHDYNQMKNGVDAFNRCIENHTVRRISRRWPMIVFYNMIDIALINAMTIWLGHNASSNIGRMNSRRALLTEVSRSLMEMQQKRRATEIRLMPKVKIALQALGHDIGSQVTTDTITDVVNRTKRRCYLCPAQPGRKVRQTCQRCSRHVCLSHSTRVTVVTCHGCEEND